MTRIYREESCRFRVFHVQVDRVEDLGCRVLSSPFFFFLGGGVGSGFRVFVCACFC